MSNYQSDMEEKSIDLPAVSTLPETKEGIENIKTQNGEHEATAVVEKTSLDGSTSPASSQHARDVVGVSPHDFKPGWRFIVAFLSLTVVTIMVALDATSLSVALPIMSRTLGGSAIEAFWTGTSFLLTSTVFQPVIGSLSNIFGRKPAIFFSLALFGVGAIIAAVANSYTVVLIGRSIQGIGGGGVITMTEIVVTDMGKLRCLMQAFAYE
jgi:Major Facilitator Superfamily